MAIRSRILYIEDDQALGKLIQTFLAHRGYDVMLACDGGEGLEKFDQYHFDALVVDNCMPVRNGIDVLRIIAEKGPLLPTIMVTGSGDEKVAVEALKLGVMDYLIKDGNGAFIHMLPAAIENAQRQRRLLDEKRKIEHALFESEERYRRLFAAISDAVLVIDTQTLHFVDVNPTVQKLYGYTREECIGMSVLQILAEPDLGIESIRDPSIDHIPTQYHRKKDGTIFPVEISVSRSAFPYGEMVIEVVRDVSERVKTEEALRTNQHYLSKVLESSPSMIYIFDLVGQKVNFISSETTNILGYSPKQLMGMGDKIDSLIVHPDDASVLEKNYRRFESMRDGEALESEFRMLHIDGDYRWVAARETVFSRAADGKPVSILGSILDITERKAVEESIRENEQMLRLITDNMYDMVSKVDRDMNFQYVSPSHKQRLGYLPEDLQGKCLLDYFHPDDKDRLLAGFKIVLEKAVSTRAQYRCKHADGSYRHLESAVNLLFDENGKAVGAVVSSRDVTAQHELQVVIEENEEKFRSLTSSAQDAMVLVDHTGSIRFWNEAAEEIFGYSANEAKTISIETIFAQGVENNNSSEILAWFRGDCPETKRGLTAECTAVSRSGNTFPVEVSISSMKLRGICHAIAIIRDISERKAAELLQQKQTKELKESNQELDAFAHTVAHDLKNPVGAVVGLMELVGLELGDSISPDLLELLNMVNQSVRKMTGIIDSLLMLASVRKGQMKLVELDMSQILADTLERVEPYIAQYNAHASVNLATPIVMGYAPWIEEVWVNYIINGLKYGGSPAAIEIGNDEPHDGFVHFWVQDNGAGLTPEQQELLFQPFSRLHQAKIEGHGLGLSIVARIVERLGGKVTLSSTLGEGSRFGFTLPLPESA